MSGHRSEAGRIRYYADECPLALAGGKQSGTASTTSLYGMWSFLVYCENFAKDEVSSVLNRVRKDIEAVLERDPSVRSVWEVVFTFPGFHALQMHRVSHVLYGYRLFFLARLLSHINRFFTGVEIHPGAQIGAGVFIDHGMGTVIGETTIIKDNVTLYQNVTLGGTGKEKGKRHPTIEEGAVVACGAKVLGSFTVGRCARIGAGAVVLRGVPEYSTVVGVPGRVVKTAGRRVAELDHHNVPDPMARYMETLQKQISNMEERLHQLEHNVDGTQKEYGDDSSWKKSG